MKEKFNRYQRNKKRFYRKTIKGNMPPNWIPRRNKFLEVYNLPRLNHKE